MSLIACRRNSHSKTIAACLIFVLSFASFSLASAEPATTPGTASSGEERAHPWQTLLSYWTRVGDLIFNKMVAPQGEPPAPPSSPAPNDPEAEDEDRFAPGFDPFAAQ